MIRFWLLQWNAWSRAFIINIVSSLQAIWFVARIPTVSATHPFQYATGYGTPFSEDKAPGMW